MARMCGGFPTLSLLGQRLGQIATLGDLLGQVGRRRLGQRGDETQRTRIRHGRNEFRATHPLHTTLHNRVLDPERLGELRPDGHR